MLSIVDKVQCVSLMWPKVSPTVSVVDCAAGVELSVIVGIFRGDPDSHYD